MSFFERMTRFLNGSVGNNLQNNPEDVRSIKKNLKTIGYYNEEFDNGYLTRPMDIAIRNFQTDFGLKVDGKLYPGGETEREITNKLNDRRTDANTIFNQKNDVIRQNGFGIGQDTSTKTFKERKIQPIKEEQSNIPVEYDATGRMIRPEKDLAVKRKEERPVLPPPTSDPVDKKEMQKILEYDPNKGGGDFHSFLKYGLEPKNIAGQAEKEAQKIFPKHKGVEDESDAFRHALGSYIMTKRYGSKAAKTILDRHERAPGQNLSPTDTDMGLLQDLYNNRVGIDAALDPKNQNREPVEVIKELYDSGKLQTRPFVLKPATRK